MKKVTQMEEKELCGKLEESFKGLLWRKNLIKLAVLNLYRDCKGISYEGYETTVECELKIPLNVHFQNKNILEQQTQLKILQKALESAITCISDELRHIDFEEKDIYFTSRQSRRML